MWECRCDCGNTTRVTSSSLASGNTKSCGCITRELQAKNHTTHSLSSHPVHQVWSDMKQRCTNPKSRKYKDYGARGIKVCEEWQSFEVFCKWADENGYVPNSGLSIDRIDVNGDYCPENCRWATYGEQNRNTRRNVMITFHGETKCAQDWSKEFGLARSCLANRINGKSKLEIEKIMEEYSEIAKSLLPEGVFGEWKCVSKESPNDGERVLCVGCNGGMDICTFQIICGEGSYFQKRNTHFRPLYWIRIPKVPRREHLSDDRSREITLKNHSTSQGGNCDKQRV